MLTGLWKLRILRICPKPVNSKISIGNFQNRPNSEIGSFEKIQEEKYKLLPPCLMCAASRKGNYKITDFQGYISLLQFLFVSDEVNSNLNLKTKA